jgi:hypothetical protein
MQTEKDLAFVDLLLNQWEICKSKETIQGC